MSLTLIVFLFSWQEYLLPLVVLQTETLKTITVGAASLQGRYGVDYGGIAAAGLIAFAPLVVLFLLMQRSFVRGLPAGAIKMIQVSSGYQWEATMSKMTAVFLPGNKQVDVRVVDVPESAPTRSWSRSRHPVSAEAT